MKIESELTKIAINDFAGLPSDTTRGELSIDYSDIIRKRNKNKQIDKQYFYHNLSHSQLIAHNKEAFLY